MSKQVNKSRADKTDTIECEIQLIFDGHTWQNYMKVGEFTCSVYPGSQWNDTTLFIWRRSPTLIPFIGTTGSGQLVKDTAKWMMNGNKNMEREKQKEISNYNKRKYQINLNVTLRRNNHCLKNMFFSHTTYFCIPAWIQLQTRWYQRKSGGRVGWRCCWAELGPSCLCEKINSGVQECYLLYSCSL